MGSKTIHMSVDVRGMLSRLHRSRAKMGPCQHDDGRRMTRLESIDALFNELSQGREVLPLGKPCEGFDFRTGCPGHPVPESAEVCRG